jgi:phenylacetate-coenzyme A ligase PaaK-like adenylate-forming protein
MHPEIDIFNINSEDDFLDASLKTFHYQLERVKVYADFVRYLRINPNKITQLSDIPFLPIEFFKSHEIISSGKKASAIFESSGTTGMNTSRHFVADVNIYQRSFLRGFSNFYGQPSDYCILALLPSYLERQGSSLIYMTDKLISLSAHPKSGFYLDEQEELMNVLKKLKKENQKTILLGVSFALLDLAEKFNENLSGTIIMETGGMKGRRKELVRDELHGILKQSFNVKNIHSEYGMTELLSQAYSFGDGIFITPPWMKILARDSHDPFHILPSNSPGVINIIDLANIYSCSFIATSDLGKTFPDGGFEVTGRMDAADIRGCNLLI